RVRRFEISAFLAGIVYIIATITYKYIEVRFYIPVLFLLVALAVLPTEWAVGQALKRRFSVWSIGVLAVFLLSCIGYPTESGFKPISGRSQAWDALITQTPMENHSGTRRRRNSVASSGTHLVLFYPISSRPI